MESFVKEYNKLCVNNKINNIARTEIFENIFVKKLNGDNKIVEIDDFNQETLIKRINGGLPVPGYIYTFIYKNDKLDFNPSYYDKFPLLFIVKSGQTHIEGINLNLIDYKVRLFFLETYYKLYKNYFDKIEEFAENNILKLNESFVSFTLSKKFTTFLNYIYTSTGHDIKYAYRKYIFKSATDIRLLELNKWKYIPFYIPEGMKLNRNIKNLYIKKIG